MAHFSIKDETVHAAFDTLQANVEPAAAARAEKERRDYAVKQIKAKIFLMAEGTVAEREALAIASKEYNEAVQAHCDAVESDEYYRNTKSKCEAIIEAWRSCQATERAMGKVG
jgi:xanthine dehydrogenase iron-sulfur cluster and FAD-binding subunit A